MKFSCSFIKTLKAFANSSPGLIPWEKRLQSKHSTPKEFANAFGVGLLYSNAYPRV